MDEHGHNNLDDLERIFNLHHQRVYALSLRMTSDVTEAERLTEDVFVQVFHGLQSLPQEAVFSTWLDRLTVNRVLMHFRNRAASGDQTRKDSELPDGLVESGNGCNRPPMLRRSLDISKSRLHKARMRLRHLLTRRISHCKIDEVIRLDSVN